MCMALQATITVPSPSQIKNDQSRYETLANGRAQRSVPVFHPGGVTCDVTAIAVAAAAVYSFHHVTCAHDSHALMQSRVAAVGAEHSSLACLFTQKRRYYCCGVNYRLVKIRALIMSTFANAHWSKSTL